MTKIVSEVILMMRPRTVSHTHAIVQVLNRIAGQTTGNNGTVAGLTIWIALDAVSCVHV